MHLGRQGDRSDVAVNFCEVLVVDVAAIYRHGDFDITLSRLREVAATSRSAAIWVVSGSPRLSFKSLRPKFLTVSR